MSSEQFSLRIPSEIKNQLENLSKATGRTKAFLAIEAIERYLELEAWQINAIQKGLKDVEEGKHVSIEDVKNEWEIN